MNRAAIVFFCGVTALFAQQSHTLSLTLQKADELADLYNWVAAAPLYAQAERAFRNIHDERNALYAHIGYLRATMESENLPKLSTYFGAQAAAATVNKDPELAIKCYIVKGDVDAEIDSALAETDWNAVLRLAEQLRNVRWVNRATGEIGFHRFVQGDHETAKKNTALALLAARKSGDFAAAIRFLSGIGTGLEIGGATDQAHDYLDRALDTAQKHPETGYLSRAE